LRQQEKGQKVSDICREHGISQATFYQWQKKYCGVQVNELRRMKEMESKLSQFKRIVADLALQKLVLKTVNQKSSDTC
jgi:putative transposase